MNFEKLAIIFIVGLILGNLIGRYLILRQMVKAVFDGYLIR